LSMDAHRVIQWIVAILVIMFGARYSPVFADTAPVIYRKDFNLPLLDPIGPGQATTDAVIDISDHFIIADLDVRIDITHTRVFDLQLILQSPVETRVCLNKYEFDEIFVGENYTDTFFDDEAELAIEQGTAPFTGHFRPETGYLLESFDGQDAYGPWRLEIYDWWPTDTGTLDRLELTFTEVPEPATSALLVLATFLAVITRPQKKQTMDDGRWRMDVGRD